MPDDFALNESTSADLQRRIAQLERSNRALLDSHADIEKLLAFQSRLSVGHSVEEIFDLSLQAAAELSENLGSGIFLFADDDRLHLRSISQSDYRDRFLLEAHALVDVRLLDWLFKNMQPIILPAAAEGEHPRLARSVIVAPLTGSGRRVGVMMTLVRQVEEQIDNRLLKLYNLFAYQVGLSIDNTRLVSQVRDYNQRLAREVEEKTSELKYNNMRLEAAVEELRTLDHMKDNFLSTVSHELRTPMTAIRGSVGLILGGQAGAIDDKVKYLLEITHRNTDRLLRLINTLLDLNKLESGRMTLEPEPLNVAELARSVVTELDSFAAERNVTIEVAVDDDVTVEADPDKVTQVLHNLSSNAIKFSGEGRVTVHVSAQGSWGRIAVQDTGIGISEENLDKVFGKFYQVEQDMNRAQEGSGLGLAITKAIVEAHGGRIRVESAEGQGSTFTVDLPPRPPCSEAREAA